MVPGSDHPEQKYHSLQIQKNWNIKTPWKRGGNRTVALVEYAAGRPCANPEDLAKIQAAWTAAFGTDTSTGAVKARKVILEVTDTPVIAPELFSEFITKISHTHFKQPSPGSHGVEVSVKKDQEETAKFRNLILTTGDPDDSDVRLLRFE